MSARLQPQQRNAMPNRLRSSLFVLMPLCAVGAAQAQSSVTVYGIADIYGQYVHGDDATMTRLQSGGLSGSRLGFKGTEDLGGGLSANFTLEMGINLDDGSLGQGGLAFGRQATVGIADRSLGALTLGRQYSATYNVTDQFSMFSNSGYGPSTAVIGGFDSYEPVRGSSDSATGNGGPARMNNSVAYVSPTWGGFSFGAGGGFGEVVDGAGSNRLWDAFARYTAGGFDAMLSFDDDQGGSINPDAHRRTWTAAAKYALADWQITGGYLYTEDRSGADLGGSGAWLGMGYRFGATLVKVQYVLNDPRNVEDAKTQALGAGLDYSFSKRTTVYTALTYYKNDDGVASGLGRTAFTLPAGMGSSQSNDYTEFVTGVRHRF